MWAISHKGDGLKDRKWINVQPHHYQKNNSELGLADENLWGEGGIAWHFVHYFDS